MNHELTTCEKTLRLDFKLSRIPTPLSHSSVKSSMYGLAIAVLLLI